MPERRLPVRPDLDQLKHQAKDLLRALRRGDAEAVAEFQRHHPGLDPARAKLADAQLVLARSYQAPSWPRLVQACELIDAIWRDDVDAVGHLVAKHPQLIHENAVIRSSNWGPPMSYAANLGCDRIITMLHERGATDHGHALGRATLQGRIGTARLLHAMMGAPRPSADALGGPAYTLSASGTALVFELGGELPVENGKRTAPVDVVLQTDSRNPPAKHQILAMYAEHGFEYPDTPVMALHRGRLDRLEAHLRRDPALLTRTFTYEEIFSLDLGCHEERLPRTTLAGATLLHICVEFAEVEIARWLLERGMPVDAPAAVDADGFGGHTALFGAVVSYPNFWPNYGATPDDAPLARLLLEHGANPNARASLREQVMDGNPYVATGVRLHRDLTPLAWGERFHNPIVVSRTAMRLIAEQGGHG